MMTRNQLQYRYEWSDLTDSDFDPIPSPSNILLRTDGFQVLRFINHCAHIWGMTPENRLGYKELEIILQEFVPEQLVTQAEISEWIDENYKWYLVAEIGNKTEVVVQLARPRHDTIQ